MLAQLGEDYPSAFETGQLFSKVFGITRQKLAVLRNEPADETKTEAFYALIQKRLTGYPLQYLVGEWDFYGRSFAVGEGVLVPRGDTETLVDAVLLQEKGRLNCCVADLCSGSGCIACTIALEMPSSKVYAVELSDEALPYLQQNVQQHKLKNVQIVHEDVAKFTPPQKLDLVVSNPPYLTADDMQHLQQEVSFEPSMALFAGEDGLNFYRQIAGRYFPFLHHKGSIFFEVGMGQHKDVAAILEQAGFGEVRYYKDVNDIPRVVTAVRP